MCKAMNTDENIIDIIHQLFIYFLVFFRCQIRKHFKIGYFCLTEVNNVEGVVWIYVMCINKMLWLVKSVFVFIYWHVISKQLENAEVSFFGNVLGLILYWLGANYFDLNIQFGKKWKLKQHKLFMTKDDMYLGQETSFNEL